MSTGTTRSENAQSYMRKLGQHWSHRFPVSFEDTTGCTIQMPQAVCELRAYPDRLDVDLTTENEEDQERLQEVVVEHVRRFAFREDLQFSWRRV